MMFKVQKEFMWVPDNKKKRYTYKPGTKFEAVNIINGYIFKTAYEPTGTLVVLEDLHGGRTITLTPEKLSQLIKSGHLVQQS